MRQEFNGKFSHHHEPPEGGVGQVAQLGTGARSALACAPQTAVRVPVNLHCPRIALCSRLPVWGCTSGFVIHRKRHMRETGPP